MNNRQPRLLISSGTEGRVPPQAVDIEAQVLGAMLLEKDAIDRVSSVLDENAFHADYHRKIYQAITALHDKGERADIITLSEELRKRGHLELVGGETYIAELTMKVTSAANVEYHAKIILEKSLMRNLIIASSSIAARGYSPTEDAFELIDEYEQSAFEISSARFRGSKTIIQMAEGLHKTLEMVEAYNGKGLVGIPSGLTDLDNLTGGWRDADLIIIAGRPGSGKSALATTALINAAKIKRTAGAIFSLEMPTNQIILRSLCQEAKINLQAAYKGELTEHDWMSLNAAATRLHPLKIFYDDTAGMSLAQLRAKARRLKTEHNIGWIVIDYLQLMHGHAHAESREKEIAAISRGLKELAKELNIPVVALSQLSREVESRNDKRPILSDLRESGAIEQDADVVVFVYRPEMYGIDTYDDGGNTNNTAELIIAKQRNGPLDTARVQFVKRFTLFRDLNASDTPEQLGF